MYNIRWGGNKRSTEVKTIGSYVNEKLRIDGWQLYVHKKMVSNSVMLANTC